MTVAVGRRFFHPSGHLWLRVSAAASFPTQHPWLVEIGISARGLADIGDVTSITAHRDRNETSGWFARAGDNLVTIDWDAHIITSADELYHTIWDTVSEQTVLRAPISGVVDHIKTINTLVEDLDEDTVLVKMKTDYESLNESSTQLMDEEDYQTFLAAISPGKFSSET